MKLIKIIPILSLFLVCACAQQKTEKLHSWEDPSLLEYCKNHNCLGKIDCKDDDCAWIREDHIAMDVQYLSHSCKWAYIPGGYGYWRKCN